MFDVMILLVIWVCVTWLIRTANEEAAAKQLRRRKEEQLNKSETQND